MISSGTTTQAATCSCATCGSTSTVDLARVTGVWCVENGATRWYCPGCTRAQLRDIEAGIVRQRPARP